MELVKSIIILVIGFALLMKGADYFVEGSSSVAKRLYIPSMIIGMTIVAIGTFLILWSYVEHVLYLPRLQ